jgi:PPP family 3-phenylpropionic acid transporter
MYFIIWGTQFIGSLYMPIYIRSFSFTSDIAVGLIMSLGNLMTTVAQPVWGSIADHAKTKNRVLLTAVLCAAAGIWLVILPKHTSYLTLVPSVSLFTSILIIPGMLIDTIVVENIDGTGVPFGKVRGFSSAGAGAAAFSMFLISLAVTLKPVTTFLLAFCCAVLSLIPLRYFPLTKGHARGVKKNKEKTGLMAILKNRRLVLLLFYIFFLLMGLNATNTFLGIYYATDKGLNAGIGMYGLFFAICIAVETCLMMFGSKFLNRMDIYHLFTLVSAAACLRSLTIYLAPNVYVMQLCAVFHALLFAPLWTRLSPYVNSIVPKEMRATGQAAWSIMGFGFGPMVGSSLAGVISSRFGIRNLFLFTASMLCVTTLVFTVLFHRQRVMDRAESEQTENAESLSIGPC